MAKYKYISTISEEEFNNSIVIPCTDEENYTCILIKNALEKTVQSTYSTENLDFKLNRVLTKDSKDCYFHIIKCKKQDIYSLQQFDIIFEYVFGKINTPLSDVQMGSLITSLEDYFKIIPDKDKTKIQTGVFGELFTVWHMHNNGYQEIVDKFHKDFFSKHDIEISPSIRLEIKTTDGEKRIHHFKHNQINRNDINVYVVSVMLERSQEGLTLYDLFEKVKELFSEPEFIFALEKLKRRCGVSEEDKGLSFAVQHAIQHIRFFDANDLPKLEGNIPDSISAVEYDIDCSGAKSITLEELLQIIR